MTSDLDIYRTASVLFREHGEEADSVAALRTDSSLEAGDMAGSAVRCQVLKAIKEMRGRSSRRGNEESVWATYSVPVAGSAELSFVDRAEQALRGIVGK